MNFMKFWRVQYVTAKDWLDLAGDLHHVTLWLGLVRVTPALAKICTFWMLFWSLSVRLSVCPCLTLSPGRHKKLKIGRKEVHDTDDPWPHLEVERSKVKVTRPINAVTDNQPYHWLTNFKLGIWMEYDDPHHWHALWPSKLKAVDGCSSHHLQGTGGILWRPHYRRHFVAFILNCF